MAPYLFAIILFLLALYRINLLVRSFNDFKASTETDIIKLKRTFIQSEHRIYSELSCEVCHVMLPENTNRTSDGHWLCSEHKIEHFANK